MMGFGTTIGFLCNEEQKICTVADLLDEVENGYSQYTVNQYCDAAFPTDLERFVYDPYTGDKINWEEINMLLAEEN